MNTFEKLTENIYRLWVPFENLFTSVYLIKTPRGGLLVDCATTEHDVRDLILPAAEETGIKICAVALTHIHGDHAGGLPTLVAALPDIEIYAYSDRVAALYPTRKTHIIRDGDMLLDCIKAVHLPGHSADAMGYLDTRDGALIGGDAVQLYGIGRYGCGIGMPAAYRESLKKLSQMQIETYIAAHEFAPLGALATGDGVGEYFAEARRDFENIVAFVKGNMHLGDSHKIAAAFTEEMRKAHPEFPSLQSSTVSAIMREG